MSPLRDLLIDRNEADRMIRDLDVQRRRRKARRFRVGQLVHLSRAGMTQGLIGRALSPKGVVTGIGHDGVSMRVRPDGLRKSDGYSVDFWDLLPKSRAWLRESLITVEQARILTSTNQLGRRKRQVPVG